MGEEKDFNMKTGIELIAKERARQISQEGWTPEHDDEHCHGEISQAALCYTEAATMQAATGENVRKLRRFRRMWPWEWALWKPSEDPVRNLVKAGALIAAEIDRLERRKERP